MDVYKIPIEYAFIVFPFIAFILTIPFFLHQYRKFGAIPMLKSACFYSMVLYLICAYFLVILPLPSIEKVSTMNGPISQLKPFQFVNDIILTTPHNISTVDDILNIFKTPTVYTMLFNLVLTMPFGVYLRYIFKVKWYQSLLYSFFLSLFFEVTQLSGLYGVYPRPYRLFDVDDLLVNSLGGLIGHIITPLLTIWIPSIDKLDEKSYKKGTKVTLLRRVVSLMIDILFILLFDIVCKILLYKTIFKNYSFLIVITFYYIIIPPFISGKTLGKKVIRIKISGVEHTVKWYQILIRNILLVYIFIYPFSWINILSSYISTIYVSRIWTAIIVWQYFNILYYIYTVIFEEKHMFFYEKVTQTINVSTIETDNLKNNQDKLENEEPEIDN